MQSRPSRWIFEFKETPTSREQIIVTRRKSNCRNAKQFAKSRPDVRRIHMLNQRNGAGSNLTADVARNGITTGLKNSSR